jgi:hypothetical protein
MVRSPADWTKSIIHVDMQALELRGQDPKLAVSDDRSGVLST